MGLKNNYEYEVFIERWIDGDTFVADVDLGFEVMLKGQTFRLYGVDTPEMRPMWAKYTDELGNRDQAGRQAEQAMAREALLFCEESCPPGFSYLVRTVKDRTGKYGRYLAVIPMGESSSRTLNQALLDRGLAKVPDYA